MAVSARLRSADPRLWRIGWLVVVIVLAAVVGVSEWVDLPARVVAAASSLLATAYAAGLAVRAGGRPWLSLVIGLLMSAVTVGTMDDRLLSGAAVTTAIVAAVLAVLATVPAPTFVVATREVLIASVVATVGGVAVWGYHAPMDAGRFDYVVLAGALVGMVLIVFQLGAGFHGLGRRGYVLCGAALVALAIALAYTEALSRWGSAEMIDQVDTVRMSLRDALGAVPHPIEAFFGLPVLAWGIFMRSRRRQGWWVAAFGACATAAAAGRLVEQQPPSTIALGTAYSLVVGLLLAFVVIRIELAFTSRGRRSRRAEAGAVGRPEPGRMHPLQ